MKIVIPIALLVILALVFGTPPAFAQSDQATSTIVLNHLNVQLTYPAHVLPGQLAIINLTAQAKDTFGLASLTLLVYSADQNSLKPVLSTIVAGNIVMLGGDQISRQIQLTVPSGAPRTSLIAQVTESASTTTYPEYNLYYQYRYVNGVWYPYYLNFYYGYAYSPTGYGYPIYPYAYNSQGLSDGAIAPLSYVLATTPEEIALQSQNQQLQTQNQQLQQQLQSLQNSTAQKDSTINSLNNQLASLQGTTILVEIIAVILAIALVAVAALHFKTTRTA